VAPIWSGDERVQPHERRGEIARDERARRGDVEIERPVEIAQSDVDAGAPSQNVLDLGIRLASPERRRQLDEASSGAGNSRPARAVHDQLAMRALAPAPPAELDHGPPPSVSTTAGREPPSRRGCT
jgi:hypothetical protein